MVWNAFKNWRKVVRRVGRFHWILIRGLHTEVTKAIKEDLSKLLYIILVSIKGHHI